MSTRTLYLALTATLASVACGPPAPLDSDGVTTTTGGSQSGSSATATATTASETSTSTDTEPSGSSSATSSAEGLTDFVPPDPDLIDTWCDSFAQDCPDGEKCVPYSHNGGGYDDTKCVPILGAAATGEPCTSDGPRAGTDSCDGTGMCWNLAEVDDEQVGTCQAFCTGTLDSPMCAANSMCLLSGEGTLNLCFPTCDPIEQDCPSGQACHWANQGFSCIVTSEDLGPNEACGFINDCEAGLSCITGELLPDCEGPSCCSPYCDLDGGDAMCASIPGTSCSPFFEQGGAPRGQAHIGVCLVP